MSVVAGVSMVSMVGKSVAMVETVSVVGIPVVVVGIGIGFRSSFRSSLGIRRSLAIVVAVETAIDRGESVQRTSVDGGHGVRGSSHKGVAVVGVRICSGLRISRPLAIVVSKGIGVSVVAVSVSVSVGEPMAVMVAKVVAVAVAMSVSIGLSCHGSKEAKSSNGLKMKLEFGKSHREDLKRKFCCQKFSPRISS